MTDSYTMVFTVNACVVDLYRGFAVVMSVITGYVWWRTNHDAACSRNSKIVQRVRSWGLIGTSSVLCVSAVCFSIELALLVIVLGSVNMAINAYALRERSSTPNNKMRLHVLGGRRISFRPLMMFRHHHHDPAE